MARNKNMVHDTFLSPGKIDNEADKKLLEWKCERLAGVGWEIVSVEYGEIPQAGSAIEGAPNFGMTEPGWTIKVQRQCPEPPEKLKRSKKRPDAEHPSRWLWEWD